MVVSVILSFNQLKFHLRHSPLTGINLIRRKQNPDSNVIMYIFIFRLPLKYKIGIVNSQSHAELFNFYI